jgi:hypothetical protein
LGTLKRLRRFKKSGRALGNSCLFFRKAGKGFEGKETSKLKRINRN